MTSFSTFHDHFYQQIIHGLKAMSWNRSFDWQNLADRKSDSNPFIYRADYTRPCRLPHRAHIRASRPSHAYIRASRLQQAAGSNKLAHLSQLLRLSTISNPQGLSLPPTTGSPNPLADRATLNTSLRLGSPYVTSQMTSSRLRPRDANASFTKTSSFSGGTRGRKPARSSRGRRSGCLRHSRPRTGCVCSSWWHGRSGTSGSWCSVRGGGGAGIVLVLSGKDKDKKKKRAR